MENGAVLALLIDGQYQNTASNVSIQTNGGWVRIDTLEGLAGWSPGSGDVTVTGTAYVPTGGYQFNFHDAVANGTFHTVQVPIGGQTYRGEGIFTDQTTSQSVNGAVEVSFTWVGELLPLA